MDHVSLIGTRCRALLLITVLLAACGEREPVFSSLALAIGGLDFPHTRQTLDLCRQRNDEACLKSYRRVKTARDSLLSRPRNEALKRVFETIGADCGQESADLATEMNCTGAVAALYFFPGPEDDRAIREFFHRLPPSTLKKVIASGGDWPGNRENKPAWRQWVAESPLSSEDRQALLVLLDRQPNPELTLNHLDASD